jgi:hypothetical protein
MRSLSYVLVIAALICCHAKAAQITVGDLLELCTSSEESSKTACRFYILGVTEGASLAASTAKDKAGDFRDLKDKPFCVPESLASTAMEFVVRKSMGEDLAIFPADRDLPAVSFVTAVIVKNFPCGRPK